MLSGKVRWRGQSTQLLLSPASAALDQSRGAWGTSTDIAESSLTNLEDQQSDKDNTWPKAMAPSRNCQAEISSGLALTPLHSFLGPMTWSLLSTSAMTSTRRPKRLANVPEI